MADPTHAIAVDLARVFDKVEAGRKLLATLAWGDKVKVLREVDNQFVEIELMVFGSRDDGTIELLPKRGFIIGDPDEALMALGDNRVLKIDFVDVQQGDGAILETPEGKVMLIDGGDNQLFVRYLAARYPGTTAESAKELDCILVTHGDADHFQGLNELLACETHPTAQKRFFVRPKRIYHNGIVKLPSKNSAGAERKDVEMLGATTEQDNRLFLTSLVTDITDQNLEMNVPFSQWRKTLRTYKQRDPSLRCSRIEMGDNAKFGFLSAGEPSPIRVEVLGPIVEEIEGSPALPFLRTPGNLPRSEDDSLATDAPKRGAYSASHTINGHSIVLRVDYGRFSFLLAGDLNDEAEKRLTRSHNDGELSLTADVFKVPHHGSADFSAAFMKAVAPAVSIVSSGDESSRKEFIHPRANLMGALGKYSRTAEPLIFVTEMVAFFEMVGYVSPKEADAPGSGKRPPKRFFAFQRSAFGIVKTRTDGERLLVHTNSGSASLKEAYAYVKSPEGNLIPSKVTRL